MITLLCWLLLPLLFAGAARLGRSLGLLPIVSHLLLACIGLPLLALYGLPAEGALSQAELIAPWWLKLLYSLCFALLLGHILGDVIELRPSLPSLKIALPSFLVPFFCGLACAYWLLPLDSWLARLALGLLFALSAIPILHLYLRSIGYDEATSRRLLQSAILIDLLCWGLFALAQGGSQPASLLLTLLAALLPLALHRLGLRHPLGYSLPFFALMLVFQLFGGNALLFGIGYLLCLARLGLPLRMPLRPVHWQWLQQYLAIPLLLTYGILQVDFQQAVAGYSPSHLLALVLLPIASKLLGNWLGLRAGRCRRQVARKPATEHSRADRNRLSQPAAGAAGDQRTGVFRPAADELGFHPVAGHSRHRPSLHQTTSGKEPLWRCMNCNNVKS